MSSSISAFLQQSAQITWVRFTDFLIGAVVVIVFFIPWRKYLDLFYHFWIRITGHEKYMNDYRSKEIHLESEDLGDGGLDSDDDN